MMGTQASPDRLFYDFCLDDLVLAGRVPNHSIFSRNRHGRCRQSNILRRVFESVVLRCLAEGLVGGEGFAVDASLMQAGAMRQPGVNNVGIRSSKRSEKNQP